MIINHNIAALNTHRQLGMNNNAASGNLEKLSSGLKINRAGDDAAGLAISEKMRGQIRGLDMAAKNSQDGISLIQTAEGALNETHSILQRMRELAVQAGNDTNTESDRGEIQKEINQLTSEINRIGNTTEFNTKKLANGELSSESVVTPGVKGTMTDVDKAITQDVAVGDNPVTWDNGSQAKFDIKFDGTADNGFDWAAIDGTVPTDNQLVIQKDTNGEITVSFAGTDGTNTLEITADKLAFDADNGTYTYDNHGISFTLTQAEVDGWEAGEKATIDLNVVGTDVTQAAVNTDSGIQTLSATTGAGDTAATMTDFKVNGDSKQLLAGVTDVKVEYTAAGGLTVTLNDAAGDPVSSTNFSWDGTGDFEYNANGIEFKLNLEQSTAIDSTFKLQTETAQVEVGGTAAVTEDKSVQFQIGANENQAMSVGINDMRAAALGITGSGAGFTSGKDVTDGTDSTAVESAVDVSTHTNAAKAVTTIQSAIDAVSAERSKLGAVQNRLEHTINNLGTSSENLTAAESRIRDVDYVLTAA